MQIPVLQQAGFRVIAPDLRGCGDTDKPDSPESYGIMSLVEDVAGIAKSRTYAQGISRVGIHVIWEALWKLVRRFKD